MILVCFPLMINLGLEYWSTYAGLSLWCLYYNHDRYLHFRRINEIVELTRPRLLVTSLVELFPPELLAISSDKDSRLSVLWPLISRIVGDFSSWKLFNLGLEALLFGEVTNFPPAIWHHVMKIAQKMIHVWESL